MPLPNMTPTAALRIDGFMRPFTLPQVRSVIPANLHLFAWFVSYQMSHRTSCTFHSRASCCLRNPLQPCGCRICL